MRFQLNVLPPFAPRTIGVDLEISGIHFDFDIILWGWASDPDPNLLLSVYSTGEIPNGYNETRYSNPAYDELHAQQGVELDLEKRRELVWQMQEIVFNDVVYIIPYYDQANPGFPVR